MLLPEGEAALQALSSSLASADPELRAAAARELRSHPEAALPLLCRALADSHEDVRVAAAESLGILGDARAVEPLTTALQRWLIGGSGKRQYLAGVLLVVGVSLAVVGWFWGMVVWRMGGLIVIASNTTIAGARMLAHRRRVRSKFCVAVTDALTRIAEQQPTPQLLQVIPELRALAADRIHQDYASRQASRAAADRIEALTRNLKSLPISSTAAPLEASVLPLISDAPSPPAADAAQDLPHS